MRAGMRLRIVPSMADCHVNLHALVAERCVAATNKLLTSASQLGKNKKICHFEASSISIYLFFAILETFVFNILRMKTRTKTCFAHL
jgi:hypothetical protein